MVIRSFDVISVGKIQGILGAFFGLLAGGMFSLISLAGLAAARGGGIEALIFGVGAVVVLPLFYGVVGFVGGCISALIYNLAAGVVGGIEMEIERTPRRRSDEE